MSTKLTIPKLFNIFSRAFLTKVNTFIDHILTKLWSADVLGDARNKDIHFFEILSNDVYSADQAFIINRKYQIDEDWIQDLGLRTQIVAKSGYISLNHGRILYSVIREYIDSHKLVKYLTIVETGTARGFSSLCMAKALDDSKVFGKILTFDVLPHETKTYWNGITDRNQRLTRQELLSSWKPLVDNYITFVEGDTLRMLRRISLSRVNIAFLDACHIYNAVIMNVNYCLIVESDLIVFDDVNQNLFPGVVKAAQVISSTLNYGQPHMI